MVMRVFVAGGTGVIGRRLVPQLVARGHQVTATTTSAHNQPRRFGSPAGSSISSAADPSVSCDSSFAGTGEGPAPIFPTRLVGGAVSTLAPRPSGLGEERMVGANAASSFDR